MARSRQPSWQEGDLRKRLRICSQLEPLRVYLDSELNQAWKEELREHSTMQAAVLSSGKKAMLKRWGWRVVRR